MGDALFLAQRPYGDRNTAYEKQSSLITLVPHHPMGHFTLRKEEERVVSPGRVTYIFFLLPFGVQCRVLQSVWA